MSTPLATLETHPDLLTGATREFRDRLRRSLEQALRRLDETLFDLGEATLDNKEQQSLFQGMRVFRSARTSLPGRIDELIADGLRPLRGLEPELPQELFDTRVASWGSPLVEVAALAEIDCGDALGRLRPKLARVADEAGADPAVDPLSPSRIARCLVVATRELEAPRAALHQFMRHVERFVFTDLQQAYDELEGRLEPAGATEPPADREEPAAPSGSADASNSEATCASEAAGNLAAQLRALFEADPHHAADRRRHIERLYRSILDHSPHAPAARRLVERTKSAMLRRTLHGEEQLPGGCHGPRIIVTRMLHVVAPHATTDDRADRIFGKMSTWLADLAGIDDAGAAPFRKLLKDLDGLARTMDDALEASQEATPKRRTRIEEARAMAEAEIDQRLGKREVAPVVEGLVGVAWANVLVLDYLRHGPASAQWQDSLTCLDDLIWTSRPKRSAADVARLQSMLPQLSRQLRQGLEKVAFDEDHIEEVFDHLRDLYKGLMEEQYRDKLHMPTARAASPLRRAERLTPSEMKPIRIEPDKEPLRPPTDEEIDQAAGGEPASTEAVEATDPAPGDAKRSNSYVRARVEALKAGAWLEFQAADGSRIRAKLSWVSPISKNYLFVSESGVKLADKSLDELTDEVARGETLLLDATPVFGAPGRA